MPKGSVSKGKGRLCEDYSYGAFISAARNSTTGEALNYKEFAELCRLDLIQTNVHYLNLLNTLITGNDHELKDKALKAKKIFDVRNGSDILAGMY